MLKLQVISYIPMPIGICEKDVLLTEKNRENMHLPQHPSEGAPRGVTLLWRTFVTLSFTAHHYGQGHLGLCDERFVLFVAYG